MGESGRGLWIELGCVSVTLVFAAASMIHSPEPSRAFRVILPMLYGLCAIAALSRLTAMQCRRMVYGLLAAGFMVVFASLVAAQFSSVRHLVAVHYRFCSFFDNANQLGLTIIALMPLSLALLLSTSRPFVKALCLATTLVLFYALVLTGAKASLAIGFITASLLYIYHSARNDRLWKIVTRLGFAAALLAFAVPATLWIISWASPVTYEKIMTILSVGIVDYPSMQSREILWEESWRLGVEHPWTGTGAGSHLSASGGSQFDRTHSHNLILDYFRGVGAFGALAMLVLLVTVAVRATSFYRSTLHKGAQGKWLDTIIVGLYLGALGYIIGNQLSDSLSPSTSFFFWAVYTTAYVSSEGVARAAQRGRYLYRAMKARHGRLSYVNRRGVLG
jgi:O-antigen ligase